MKSVWILFICLSCIFSYYILLLIIACYFVINLNPESTYLGVGSISYSTNPTTGSGCCKSAKRYFPVGIEAGREVNASKSQASALKDTSVESQAVCTPGGQWGDFSG